MRVTLLKGNVLWKGIPSRDRETQDGSRTPIYVPLPGVRMRLHIDNDKERNNLVQQLKSGETEIFLPYIKELKELSINERLD